MLAISTLADLTSAAPHVEVQSAKQKSG